jgi:thiamine-phosphate pyrophosphorylase
VYRRNATVHQKPTTDPALSARLAEVRLYVITDATHQPERVLWTVRGACDGGAEVIQLRRKGGDDLETLLLAQRCREITRKAQVLLVIDDRLDIAMAVDADGVHLGQDDLPVTCARRLWPGRIIGRSTHSLDQASAARAEGADYIGVGPVFATPTKPGRPPVGTQLVTAVAGAELGIPWVAIGGIDPSNAEVVLAAGAPALAVVRAVTGASDPAAAAAGLRRWVVQGVGVVA